MTADTTITDYVDLVHEFSEVLLDNLDTLKAKPDKTALASMLMLTMLETHTIICNQDDDEDDSADYEDDEDEDVDTDDEYPTRDDWLELTEDRIIDLYQQTLDIQDHAMREGDLLLAQYASTIASNCIDLAAEIQNCRKKEHQTTKEDCR